MIAALYYPIDEKETDLDFLLRYVFRNDLDDQIQWEKWYESLYTRFYVTEFDFWAPLVGEDEATRFGYSKTRPFRSKPSLPPTRHMQEEH